MNYNIDECSIEERNWVLDYTERLKNTVWRNKDGLSSIDVIIKSMIDNKDKYFWHAKDFQHGDCFVGYEATSRMSVLMKRYPNMIKVLRVGRYRLLGLNWDDKEDLPMFIEKFKDLNPYIY